MRQIFSVRFFAAVGAVVGLFFLLTTIFATREVIEGDGGGDADAVELHAIDFVEQVYDSANPSFRVVDGVAASDAQLIIDGSRSLYVVAGTPGVDHCPRLGEIAACAVVADLLGEAVVWFALVPMGPGGTVELPAIDTLDDGVATLFNGWQLPFAPVLDRRCGDDDFESYREFRDVMGDDFVSIYRISDRELVAVQCRERVPYAPEVDLAPVTTTTVASTTIPVTPTSPDSDPAG
jgi:hypothetical protein